MGVVLYFQSRHSQLKFHVLGAGRAQPIFMKLRALNQCCEFALNESEATILRVKYQN